MKKIIGLLLLTVLSLCILTLAACSDTADTYTVTFDSQGGGDVAEKAGISAGTHISAPSPAPTREGYTLTGWFKEPNCNTAWRFTADVVTGSITLYAKWVPISYNISYNNLLNGTNPNAVTSYTVESAAITLTAPTRIGYAGAWDTPVIPSGSTGNKIITAVWTAKEYQVQLNGQGGSGGTTQVKAVFDKDLPFADAPVKDGYSFDGYYDESSGGNQYYDSLMLPVKKWDINSDPATLYARWIANPNTLIFDGNGATDGSMDSRNTATASVIVLPACDFDKLGYVFTEWNTAPDGTGESFASGDSFHVPVSDTAVILYAQWDIITYNIVYEDTFALLHQNPIEYNVEDTFVFSSLVGTRTGYTFTGWDIPGITAGMTEHKTVTAQWLAIEYDIFYYDTYGLSNGNPLKYTIETALTFTDLVGTRSGYTFTGWDTLGIAIGSMDPLTVTAQWIIIEYDLFYAGVHGLTNNNPDKYTVEDTFVFSSLVGTRTGYTFTGWDILGVTAGMTEHKTVTAQWLAIEYDIFYEDTFGLSNGNPLKYTVESVLTFDDLVGTRNGYTFTGWDIIGIAAGSTERLTVTAQWVIIEYDIFYEETYGLTNGNPIKYTVLDQLTFSALVGTRAGYVFVGWDIVSIEAGTTEAITVTAKWGVNYLDEEGITRLAMPITTLSAAANRTLTGWYVLFGTVSGSFTLTVSGEAHLILADGCHWTVNSGGVRVTTGSTLQIYAQSTGQTAGRLSTNANIGGANGSVGTAGSNGVDGSSSVYETIWNGGDGGNASAGGRGEDSGTIILNGGVITAVNIGGGDGGDGGKGGNGGKGVYNNSNYLASGKGGNGGDAGNGGSGGNGNVTVNGGVITAISIGGGSGGNGGAIGAGGPGGISDWAYYGNHGMLGNGGSGGGGTVTVNGGMVIAGTVGGGSGGNGGDGRNGPPGYMVAGYDGANGTSNNTASIVITSASVNAAIRGSVTNGSQNGSNSLTLFVVDTQRIGAPDTEVELIAVSGGSYDFKYSKTHSDGKLYLWLPDDVTGVAVTINGVTLATVRLKANIDAAGTVLGEGWFVTGETVNVTATTESGYTWLGWFDGNAKVSVGDSLSYTFVQEHESRLLTAKWGDYNVILQKEINAAGDVFGEGRVVAGTEVTVTADTNDGYTWLGWYADGTKVSTEESLSYTFPMLDTNITLIAKWMVCPVVLEKNIDDAGWVVGVEKTALNALTTITATSNPGYTWLGWFVGTTKVSIDDSLSFTFLMTEETKTYTAKWGSYCIILEKNIAAAGDVDGEGMFVAGTQRTVIATINLGYTWLGWYDGEDKVSIDDALDYTFSMQENDVILIAKWMVCPITLQKNIDNAGWVSGIERTALDALTTITATSNAGYSFLGWFENGTKVSVGDNLFYSFPMTDAVLVFEARWVKNSDLLFFGNGASNPLIYSGTGVGTGMNGVPSGMKFIEYGEYPRVYVGNTLNSTLNTEYTAGRLVETGRSFTSNSTTTIGSYSPKLSKEYLYNGQKFIRVSVLRYASTFTTGESIPNNATNVWIHVEPIKWIIANWGRLPATINPSGSGEDNEMHLLAAEIVTGGIPFSSVLWSGSAIRSFLNNAFLNEAFTSSQRDAIKTTSVPNNLVTESMSQISESAGSGISTDDKLFLPSYYEVFHANGIFNSLASARLAKASDWALVNYTNKNTGTYNGYCDWWLRTAASATQVCYVNYNGSGKATSVEFLCNAPSTQQNGIRPAFTLKLEGLPFEAVENYKQSIAPQTTEVLNNVPFFKEGHTFAGWATSPHGEIVYQNGESYTMGLDARYVLYAVWVPNSI